MKKTKVELLTPNLGQKEREFVFAIAMKFVKNEVEADDVAQETLLLAFRHRDSFQGQSKYSTWLYRVATTTALMHLRTKKRKAREITTSQLAKNDTTWVDCMESKAPTPEQNVQTHEELESVLKHLAKLGPNYSELLKLRWFGEYTEREVSKKLHLPLTTVKTRAFRGRRFVLKERKLAA